MDNQPPPQSTRLGVLIPFGIVTLIWSSTWIVIRDQIGTVPPSWSVTYRFLVAGIAMAVYALAAAAAGRSTCRPRFGFAFALALTQFCLNFNFVYRAEAYVTSGLVAVVFAMLLVPNAVFARIFLGQRMGAQLLGRIGRGNGGDRLVVPARDRAPSPSGPAKALRPGSASRWPRKLSASTANVLQATETAKPKLIR